MSQHAEFPNYPYPHSDQPPVYGYGSFLHELNRRTHMNRGRLYGALPPKIDAIVSPEVGVNDRPAQPADDQSFFKRSDIARRRRAEHGGLDPRDVLALYVTDYWQYLQEEVAAGRAWWPNRGTLENDVPQPNIPPLEQAPTQYLYTGTGVSPTAPTRQIGLPPEEIIANWRKS